MGWVGWMECDAMRAKYAVLCYAIFVSIFRSRRIVSVAGGILCLVKVGS